MKTGVLIRRYISQKPAGMRATKISVLVAVSTQGAGTYDKRGD